MENKTEKIIQQLAQQIVEKRQTKKEKVEKFILNFLDDNDASSLLLDPFFYKKLVAEIDKAMLKKGGKK